MARYNTGNPIDSNAMKDLSDNAQNLDVLVNSKTALTQTDRLGVERKTWFGMEKYVEQSIAFSGYIFSGDYAPAIILTAYNQIVRDAVGEFWRVSGDTDLPYTLTGAGVDEDGALVSVGDAALRLDLDTDGSSIVSHTDINGKKNTLKDLFDAEQFTSASSSIAKRLKLGFADTRILVQGDSTGNEDWEFVRLMCSKIAALYPNAGVRYVAFNPATQSWSTDVVVQATPAGGKTLRVFNGCVSGSVANYWFGSRNTIAFNGVEFDLILCNYGLNHPTAYREQLQMIVEYYLNIRSAQPQAQIMHILQNRDYDIPERNENRVKAQSYVANQLGIHVIDSYSMFDKLIASTAKIDWYQDNLHPNAAGQEKLAELVTNAVMSVDSFFDSRFMELKPTFIPNGNFDQYDADTPSLPMYWRDDVAGTDTEQAGGESETGSAVKLKGRTTNNTSILSLRNSDAAFNAFRDADLYFVAARVKTTGTTYKPGIVVLENTAGTEFRSSSRNADAHGGWRWAVTCARRSDFTGSVSMSLRVYGGEVGESVVIDRVIFSNSPLIQDCRSVEGYFRVRFNDSTFDVAANTSVIRNFPTPFSYVARNSGYSIKSKPVLPTGIVHSSSFVSGSMSSVFTNVTGGSINVPAGAYEVRVQY